MAASDNWLSDYARASAKADEADAALKERSRLMRGNQNVSKVTSLVRRLLNELSMATQVLEEELSEASRQYHITDKELLRRQDMVANLKGRREHLQSQFSSSMMDDTGGRSALMGQSGGQRRTFEDTEATRGLDHQGLMSQQEQIMREQDRGLDMLSKTTQNLKQIGLVIGDTLDDHNEMLDDLSDGMDHTQRRLHTETAHVVRVTEKAKTGCMMCTIVLLILAIIVVAAAPI